MADVVHHHSKPFDRSNTYQREIAYLTENHLVNGFESFCLQDRKSDFPNQNSSICHLECSLHSW